jgi:hypothetical protein
MDQPAENKGLELRKVRIAKNCQRHTLVPVTLLPILNPQFDAAFMRLPENCTAQIGTRILSAA